MWFTSSTETSRVVHLSLWSYMPMNFVGNVSLRLLVWPHRSIENFLALPTNYILCKYLKTVLSVLKKCFCAELLTFHYISLRFLCNLKSNSAKNNEDRNEILFAHKLTGQRQKFEGKIFDRKCQDFLYVCFSFILNPVKYIS